MKITECKISENHIIISNNMFLIHSKYMTFLNVDNEKEFCLQNKKYS